MRKFFIALTNNRFIPLCTVVNLLKVNFYIYTLYKLKYREFILNDLEGYTVTVSSFWIRFVFQRWNHKQYRAEKKFCFSLHTPAYRIKFFAELNGGTHKPEDLKDTALMLSPTSFKIFSLKANFANFAIGNCGKFSQVMNFSY